MGIVAINELSKNSLSRTLYDINNNGKLLCKINNNYITLKHFMYDEKNSQIRVFTNQNIYVLSVDNKECYAIKKEYSRFAVDKEFSNNNLKKGVEEALIKYEEIPKIEVSPKELEVAKLAHTISQTLKAGFEKRALEMLKKLMFEKSYDAYANSFLDFGFSNDSQRAYFHALAIKYYTTQGKDIVDVERAFINYIFSASKHKYYAASYQAIQEYKRFIGKDPKKKQKDLYALFMSNYLLDISKDNEAYDILLDNAPLHEDVIKLIKIKRIYKIGLYKDTNKLSFIAKVPKEYFEIGKISIKPIDYFYDLDGNKIKIDEELNGTLKKKEQKKSDAKQDAIRFLE